MSDASKSGPSLAETVTEVQGHFSSDAELQGALGRLTLAGFDRADFSLPVDHASAPGSTPNQGAETPVDQIDKSQLRTMGTSMAGYAGAVVAAGATLATGGAAGVALAAAAAVGIGGAATANAIGNAADKSNTEGRNDRAAVGTLILAVRTTTPEQIQEATGIMHSAGATNVETVKRASEMLTAGVSSASWTGA